jgi:beta-glucosidase
MILTRLTNDIEGPIKKLKAFKRTEVKTGKTKVLTIDLPSSSFKFFDWGQRKMSVVPGEYEIYYGNSSDMNDLKTIKISIHK